MATAQLRIDQDGLPAGTPGLARLSGKADGALVTLTSTAPGTTNRFRLLYVPPGDTTALSSLAPVGGGAGPVWSFTPTRGVRGPYLIELVVNEGIAGEAKQRRVFGIPTWKHRIVAPALNEAGDPEANSTLTGAPRIASLAKTDRNVDRDGVDSLAGWQRALLDIATELDVGSHSQVVVPPHATCIVSPGQCMLYRGGLRGDYRGDFAEVGLPPISDGEVYGIETLGTFSEGPSAPYRARGVKALGPSKLRHVMGVYGRATSNDIDNDSGGANPEFYPGEFRNNYGASSASWRTKYIFDFAVDGAGPPAFITGFSHDEGAYHEAGSGFAYVRFIKVIPESPSAIVLKHNHPDSELHNRIMTPNGLDYYIGPGQTCVLVYGNSRFYVIGDARSEPWATEDRTDFIIGDGAWTLKSGGTWNRYDSQYSSTIVLTMEPGAYDGDELGLKETGGVGGHTVLVQASGCSMETPFSQIDDSFELRNSDRFVSMRFKWDAAFGYWRLLYFHKPQMIG